MATVGNRAFFPAAESVTGAEGIPSVTVAASTRKFNPKVYQTTVASPAASSSNT